MSPAGGNQSVGMERTPFPNLNQRHHPYRDRSSGGNRASSRALVFSPGIDSHMFY
jgi:hypothetical protein